MLVCLTETMQSLYNNIYSYLWPYNIFIYDIFEEDCNYFFSSLDDLNVVDDIII